MMLFRVELLRQKLKLNQRIEQADVSQITEETKARRKAAKRHADKILREPWREPT